MRKKYPSNISLEQFEQIRPLLKSARKKTKPLKVDLYEVFCAVHSYFAKRSEPDQQGISLLEWALKKSKLLCFAVMPKRWAVQRSFARLENAGGCGKTVSDGSIPACSSSTWHSCLYYSKNFEHVLRSGKANQSGGGCSGSNQPSRSPLRERPGWLQTPGAVPSASN